MNFIDQKLFSICMCTFNGRRFIKKQLDSIFTQEEIERVGEIIICDDKSSDQTVPIIKGFIDTKVNIKIYENEKRLGVKKNFEKCLSIACFPIIIFCDQDDIWNKGKLVEILKSNMHLSKKPTVFIHNASIIDQKDKIIDYDFMKLRGGFSDSIFKNFYKNRYIGCCLAINNALKKELLPFPEILPQHDIWIGIVASLIGRTIYNKNYLTLYRNHSDNASSASKNSSSKFWKILIFRFQFLLCIIFFWRKRIFN